MTNRLARDHAMYHPGGSKACRRFGVRCPFRPWGFFVDTLKVLVPGTHWSEYTWPARADIFWHRMGDLIPRWRDEP